MKILIKNGKIVNEGRIFKGHILVENQKIKQVIERGKNTEHLPIADEVYDATGKIIFPGFIDTHVHFREPGLTQKADIFTESRAAASSGVTTFFDMPNTKPATVTEDRLEEKFEIAKKNSLINYSFFIGATNENIDDIIKLDFSKICGIKLFMGSSTGNMLVDQKKSLEKLFELSPTIIVAHCESEQIIKTETERFKALYPENAPAKIHEFVRSAKACFESSQLAVNLAKKYGSRLHVAHVSTKKELLLFEDIPLKDKKITSEVCIPHLWFSSDDYQTFGIRIKCNPSIKSRGDRNALRKGLVNNVVDTVATDHAPHTKDEKLKPYFEAPSGMPSVEFSSAVMFDLAKKDVFPLSIMAQKMCHNPAEIFKIKNRGFLREGYFADIAILDPEKEFSVVDKEVLSRCKWSPFNGIKFKGKVCATMVNGKFVYKDFEIKEENAALRVEFEQK